MRYTRTHTYYYSEDDPRIASLVTAAKELRADFEDRAPYIDDDLRHNFMVRLSVLDGAISLLQEPAD